MSKRSENKWKENLTGEVLEEDLEEILTQDQEKCTRQLAQNVVKSVKFLLNLQEIDLSTAESVMQIKDQEGSNFGV